MSALLAFEAMSLIPFCSKEEKEEIITCFSSLEKINNFLEGNQLALRENLSNKECKRFADAVDVVSF